MLRPAFLLLAASALLLGSAGSAGAARFVGTVGPDRTITLKNRNGNVVRRVAPGRHTFVVRDRSTAHNFVLARGSTRLRGTSLAFTGRVAWTVRIRRGAVYRYFCAPHRSDMTRTFRVR